MLYLKWSCSLDYVLLLARFLCCTVSCTRERSPCQEFRLCWQRKWEEVRGHTTYKQQSSQVFDQNLPIAHKGKHAEWSRSHGAQGGWSCRELLTKSWLAVATSRTNKPWSWLVQQQGHHWMWNSWYSVTSMQLWVELTLSAGTACIAHLCECCQWCV